MEEKCDILEDRVEIYLVYLIDTLVRDSPGSREARLASVQRYILTLPQQCQLKHPWNMAQNQCC